MDYSPPTVHVEIRDGTPMIAGRRVKVMYIANLYNNGASVAEIMEQYDLSAAQVHAALAYYYDHKAAIDAALDEGEALARRIGVDANAHLAQMRARLPKNS